MSEEPNPSQSGFAMIETIVAFSILALALGVAVQTISQSVRTFARAGDVGVASGIINQLAAQELFKVAKAGEKSGKVEPAGAWRLAAQPVRDGGARPLFSVTVTVWPRGDGGPEFTYRTFSSGEAAQ
jgi:general secretion pathway protein I